MNARPPVAALLALLLSACAQQAELTRTAPETILPETPAHWQHSPESVATHDALPEWWRQYQHEGLNRTVDAVLHANSRLTRAALQVQAAALRAETARADLLPTASGSLNARTERALDSSDAPSQRSYGSNLGISWELDLWGKLRAQRDMAEWELDASHADHNAVYASLATETIRQYWQLAALNQRVATGERSLEYARNTAELAETQHRAGALSGLDFARAQRSVQTQEAALVALRQQRTEAQHALAQLLDQPPGALGTEGDVEQRMTDAHSAAGVSVETVTPAAGQPQGGRGPLGGQRMTDARSAAGVSVGAVIPKGVETNLSIPADLPADVLARRPDLTASRLRLQATLRNVDVVRLSFLPAINLTGALGTGSAALAEILSNPVAALGLGLSLPFLNFGELQRKPAIAENEFQQAVTQYRQDLLGALSEVENALSALATQREAIARQSELLRLAQQIESQSEVRYRAGASRLQDWLDAQENRRQAELSLLDARLALLQQQATLFQALGAVLPEPETPAPDAAHAQ